MQFGDRVVDGERRRLHEDGLPVLEPGVDGAAAEAANREFARPPSRPLSWTAPNHGSYGVPTTTADCVPPSSGGPGWPTWGGSRPPTAARPEAQGHLTRLG